MQGETVALSEEELGAVVDWITASFEDAEWGKLFTLDTFAKQPAAKHSHAKNQGASEQNVKNVFHDGKSTLLKAVIASTEILDEVLFPS